MAILLLVLLVIGIVGEHCESCNGQRNMNRKTISVFFLLTLTILIGIQESFAHPQYSGSCSDCHAINTAQNGLGKEMGNNNVTAQEQWSIISTAGGNAPRQKMNSMRYALGIIGTVLVVISQSYSLRKRGR